MRHVVAVIGAVALVASWSGRAGAALPNNRCGLGYAAISNSSLNQGVLSGIAGPWAVGTSSANPALPLVDEFTGGMWVPVNTPAPPNSVYAQLFGVASFAVNDVWTVGGYYGNGNNTLIEHWNGTLWSVVAGAPQVSTTLVAVAVNPRRANDAWAVGGTTVEHWNGKFWNAVSHVPHGSGKSFSFDGVAVTPTGHVWVVGNEFATQTATPWIDYFDGTQWQQVQGAVSSGMLTGVTSLQDNAVWISGGSASASDPTGPFIEHWDGSTWSLATLPMPTGLNGQFYAISAGDNNVWATGSYTAFGSTNITVPMIVVQRNGNPWIDLPTSSYLMLQFPKAIAALPRHAFETVGIGIDPSNTTSLFVISGSCVI
jgi:hypothetical protein